MAIERKQPLIRFKGFTDDWEQRKLGEIAPLRGGYAFSSESYLSKGIPIIRISNILKDGKVGGEFIYTEKKVNDNNFLLTNNDIVLAMSGATTGKIAKICNDNVQLFYQNQRVGYFNRLETVDYSFIYSIVNSKNFTIQLNSVLVAGAQPNISSKEIDSFIFNIPKKMDEQRKIGYVIKENENLITLHQRKLELLNEMKKGLLQKMFPKEGCKIPELRFIGFTDDWEQRKLGDIGYTYTGLSGKSKDDFGHGDAKFITYMNIFTNAVIDKALTESVEIDLSQNLVKKGDVFFTTSSETPDEVGMSSVLVDDMDNTYLNSFCFGFRPTLDFDSYYLASYFRSETVRKDFILLAQGISRYNISKNKAMNIIISTPSVEEQKLIGRVFLTIGNLITLHQRKLDDLEIMKKALLQKMFI